MATLFVVLVVVVARSPSVSPVAPAAHAAANPVLAALTGQPRAVADCPWLARAMDRHDPPAVLARMATARMTLTEKLGEVVLRSLGPYENVDSGVPRLCIPPLALQDGPQGLAYGDTGVTQLPSPLALGATFDTGLARDYGAVLGT
ncbi:MAG TPA: hypothetical protein VKW77_03045, partial [Acidimicrobiales bacterium]|nr:hypothetical protein [Acidimicrobiales bacterium]